MKRAFLALSCLILCANLSFSQEVGLELNGGGAEGLAHLGVNKALEKHGIPIDYPAGTSMGSIIGALDASGYTLEEMDSITRSPAFQNWIKGKASQTLDFNSIQRMDDPSWVSVDLVVDSALKTSFMPILASDVAINFALMEIFIQSSTKADQRFDNLMVPLRVIAPDVYTQKKIIIEGSHCIERCGPL
jgi:NTE family protein